MKTLGIIGGVGPLATMYYGDMLVRLTDAKTDQDHINMIILNDTNIPDRTAYILNSTNENPVPVLQKDAQQLEAMGAEVITIPCNTAHTFFKEIQSAVNVPVLHMINETVHRAASEGAKRVGILATTGTIQAGVFQQSCREAGLTPLLPDEEIQQDIMSVIYDQVKAGRPVNKKQWEKITLAMEALQCERIILGCTELSIVKKELQLDQMFLDALRVLSETAIVHCGGTIRQ